MIKLSFVGDMTCDRPFLNAAKKENGKYDFTGAFSHVAELLGKADYTVGNLETVFCGNGVEYNKGLHYNTPDSFIDELKRSGVKLLTTANNHCFDGEMQGLKRTQKLLKENNIDFTGTFETKDEKRYFIKEVSGVKVAFISYTYSVNKYTGVKIPNDLCEYVNLLRPCKNASIKSRIVNRLIPNELRRRIKIILGKPTISSYRDSLYDGIIDENYLKRISSEISAAKEEADFVVFCIHIGGQFNEVPGSYSEYMMQFLKEQGVDAVIGHHPHTIQKTQVNRNGRLYSYSLGGFNLSPSAIYINHECKPEYSQLINIYIDENTKQISKITFSFLKITEDDNAFINVYPADELYYKLNDKERQALEQDVAILYKRVTGKEITGDVICDEYTLYDSLLQ
ncbi:MAG: CapA family protein [Clostridiales bacterium]|nr:CapA family protein [Clostridiales bacterium]